MSQSPILPKQEVAPLLSNGCFGRAWYLYFQSQSSYNGQFSAIVSRGTHAERIATDPATLPDSEIFIESDRNGTIYQWDGMNWNYVLGAYSVTQAQISTIGYAAQDANSVVYVSDYGHFLAWSGSAFGWAPGERGSGETAVFEVDPTSTGWHLYDGSTVSYLKADGTLGSVTLPDLTSVTANAAFLKAGSPNAGVVAAGGFTGTPATLTGNVAPIAATATTGLNVTTGSGTIVAVETHSHPAPALTMNSYTPAGTAGDPQHIVRRPFFRQ